MSTQNLSVGTLLKKIGDIKVGMFTAWHDEKVLHSRPMTAMEIDEHGYLQFFSSVQHDIVLDVSIQPISNVSFADPGEHFYASLAGRAQFIKERSEYERLWTPLLQPWFPRGIDDPDLVLIRFRIEDAVYWSGEINRKQKLINFGAENSWFNAAETGQHGRIQFH